jgi:hypothetical protein
MEDGHRSNSVFTESDQSREGKSCGLDVEPEVAFCEGHKLKDNMKKTLIVLTTLLAAGLSTTIFGSVVVLGPGAASSGPISNGSAPINTTTSQHMIGSGAWQANGTAVSQYYLYANLNSSTEQGLGQLTISSLSSLSLSTFLTPAQAAAAPNWFLSIYTATYPGGETTSFYGNRLILEPYLANNYSNPGNQWVTWSTASGANQLRVDDTALSGSLGFYGEPTLANIQSGAITWSTYTAAAGLSGGSTTPINYGSQNIKYIVLSTGSGWAAGFTGMVDDVNINSTPGNVQFDLESVPEPTTMIAGALLLLPFGASTIRILRRNRTA